MQGCGICSDVIGRSPSATHVRSVSVCFEVAKFSAVTLWAVIRRCYLEVVSSDDVQRHKLVSG